MSTEKYIQHFSGHTESHALALFAKKELEKVDFPNRSMEDWKYTKLDCLLGYSYSKEGKEKKVFKQTYDFFMDFINGQIISSKLPEEIKEVKVEYLQSSLSDAGSIALPLLSLATSQNPKEYLITKSVEKPVHIVSECQNTTEKGLSSKSMAFTIEKEAAFKLNIYSHGEESSFSNDYFVFYLKEGASLDLVVLPQGEQAHIYGQIQIVCEKGAKVNLNQVNLGSNLQKIETYILIQGEEVEVSVNGLYLLSAEQNLESFVRVRHLAKNSISNQMFKGIVDEKARAIFDGRIFVAKGADGTRAEQLNKSLLLSSSAEVDTKPQLEIYADDVKCNHGATVSRFEEDEIFYFLSRGISRDVATDLLAKGFLMDTLNNVKDVDTKKYLIASIEKKLNQIDFERKL